MDNRKPMGLPYAECAALLTALALVAPLAVHGQTAGLSGATSRYILKDLGTAGGPNSYLQDTPRPVNNEGTVVGIADTSIPDPFDPACFYDCFVVHAFQWQRGDLSDMGALASGASSAPNSINASGVAAGLSETGTTDATAPFPPEFHAVVWKDGQIIDLGTFGGTFSYAADINDFGQVTGFALNGHSDAFVPGDDALAMECGAGLVPSEMRAFIWQQGRGMRNLGTLGGPESCAKYINQRGQVTGMSYTSYTPNAGTGIPAFEPFIWTNGRMIGLGGLGGTQGFASGINDQGQVAGESYLPGDQIIHAFFWDHGEMTDVAPASDYAVANAINDNGEVVGGAHHPGAEHGFAYLWRRGVLTYLAACSEALSINSKSQIVGQAFDCEGNGSHAFLWEKGGPAIDLNTLVAPGSNVTLTTATHITDSGVIAAQGILANGAEHAFLLIPRNTARCPPTGALNCNQE